MGTIAAVTTARNEATMIEYSLRSVAPHVDEIIFLNNGSHDATLAIADSLRDDLPNLRVFSRSTPLPIADARNFVTEAATADWVLQWDGDFVAYGEGDGKERSLNGLLDIVRKLGSEYNYVIHQGPNCGPNFDTVLEDVPIHGKEGDQRIYRKGTIRFGPTPAEWLDKVGNYPDMPLFLADRRMLDLRSHEHVFVHFRWVKPPATLAFRDAGFDYDIAVERGEIAAGSDFATWLRETGRSDDFNVKAESLLRSFRRKSMPYDFARWGAHPSLIGEILKRTPYTLLNPEDGEPTYAIGNLFEP